MKDTVFTPNEIETFGAVAVELTLRMENPKDTHSYDLFSGFPGFWEFCGLATVAFAKAETHYAKLTDAYIETIHAYADKAMALAKETGGVPEYEALFGLASDCIKERIKKCFCPCCGEDVTNQEETEYGIFCTKGLGDFWRSETIPEAEIHLYSYHEKYRMMLKKDDFSKNTEEP